MGKVPKEEVHRANGRAFIAVGLASRRGASVDSPAMTLPASLLRVSTGAQALTGAIVIIEVRAG